MAATNGWDVLKTFICCSFLIIFIVILLANLNQPKTEVTNVSTPEILSSINDIVESNIYKEKLNTCPNVITEYATYLNSQKIQFVQGVPCPDTMTKKDGAVGDWSVCYPPGTLDAPPPQLLTDLGECNLTVTAAAPWTLVAKAPPNTLSTYMPEVSYVVI